LKVYVASDVWMAGLDDAVAEVYQFLGDWVSINKDTEWSLGDVSWRTNMQNERRREFWWAIGHDLSRLSKQGRLGSLSTNLGFPRKPNTLASTLSLPNRTPCRL